MLSSHGENRGSSPLGSAIFCSHAFYLNDLATRSGLRSAHRMHLEAGRHEPVVTTVKPVHPLGSRHLYAQPPGSRFETHRPSAIEPWPGAQQRSNCLHSGAPALRTE